MHYILSQLSTSLSIHESVYCGINQHHRSPWCSRITPMFAPVMTTLLLLLDCTELSISPHASLTHLCSALNALLTTHITSLSCLRPSGLHITIGLLREVLEQCWVPHCMNLNLSLLSLYRRSS